MPEITFIRPFKHADDGVTVVEYAPGRRRVSERCAEVAIAEGAAHDPNLVTLNLSRGERVRVAPTEPADALAAAALPPEVPADWRSLPWPRMRSIASRVSDQPIRNREDAERAIEAYLAK